MTEASCDNTEMVEIFYEGRQLDGVKKANIDGALAAEILSGSGDWAPGSTPLSVFVKSGDVEREDCTFRVFGDADLDPGPDQIRQISDTVTLHVSPKEAASLVSVSVGTPVPKS